MRIYHEATRPPADVEAEIGGQVRLREGERSEVPTGFIKLKRGTPLPPRSWCEHAFNVVHWTEFPEGGHFPAMEVPHLLLDDIREVLLLMPVVRHHLRCLDCEALAPASLDLCLRDAAADSTKSTIRDWPEGGIRLPLTALPLGQGIYADDQLRLARRRCGCGSS